MWRQGRLHDVDFFDLGLGPTRFPDGQGLTALQVNLGQQVTTHREGQLVIDIRLLTEVEGTIDIFQQALQNGRAVRVRQVIE